MLYCGKFESCTLDQSDKTPGYFTGSFIKVYSGGLGALMEVAPLFKLKNINMKIGSFVECVLDMHNSETAKEWKGKGVIIPKLGQHFHIKLLLIYLR